MVEFVLKHNIDEVIKKVGVMPKTIINPAIASALNRTATTARSRAQKEITRFTGIKAGTIREKLVLIKATRQGLVATIKASPKGLNLIEFVSPSKRYPGAFRRDAGVKAKAWGRGAKVYRNTFIVKGKYSGKPVVVSRKSTAKRIGREWQPNWSKTIHGPSIPLALVNKSVLKAIEEVVATEFPKRLEHELRFRISRLGPS